MHKNYKFVKEEYIEEIKSKACELKHSSGAKILLLSNDDNEKSFSISFKTPPNDDSGVFHILEHSVLCGSKNYPVKEPFTYLLQTSMQTFLNAFTFDDKTMYPIASTNEKDLYNLMKVYLDAVFYPNLINDINIFYQEGGHKTKDGFSGVVYNEMQGVYSDPQDELFRLMSKELFPHNCYNFSAGGYPKSIRELSYTSFLENYASHYRLDNCYIILYGNFNTNAVLSFLDKNYLSKSDEINAWREVDALKDSTHTPRKIETQSPVQTEFKQFKMQTSSKDKHCGLGFVMHRNQEDIIATNILIDALAGSNEAPLKHALLSSGMCKDIDFIFSSGILQPTIFIDFKSTKNAKTIKQYFINTLSKILEYGLDKNLITASLSRTEFLLKENNPECSPGIDISVNIMAEWLYDSNKSTNGAKYLSNIEDLKNKINTDYFEKLTKNIFITNKHCCHIEIIPTTKVIDKVIGDNSTKVNDICKKLKNKQERPDRAEDIAKLPRLKKSDIEKAEARKQANIYEKNGTTIIEHGYKKEGISYINRYYDLNCLSWDDLGYAALLTDLLGKLDTKNFTAAKIDELITLYFGELKFSIAAYENIIDPNDVACKLGIKASCLGQNTHKLASLVDEIIFNTKYIDFEKIKAIISQIKINLENSFINNGHIFASSHALSCILPAYKLSEEISGIHYYKFIKNLNVDEDLCNKLSSISDKIFGQNPILSISAQEKEKETFTNLIQIKSNIQKNTLKIPECKKQELAYEIPSNVCYCGLGNDLRKYNSKYNGAYSIATNILNYGYLWNEVRVKNGAYGVGLSVSQNGHLQYFSYRDPMLQSTFEAYKNCGQWLNKLDLTDNELDGYIISSIAKIDKPQTIKRLVNITDNNYLCKCPQNNREKIRKEVLNSTNKDIKNCAKNISILSEDGIKCVIGGSEILINSNMEVEKLF